MAGGLGESIRKGVGMVHGTGEAIRGNVNAALDQASGDKASATKNQEIAQKGVDEVCTDSTASYEETNSIIVGSRISRTWYGSLFWKHFNKAKLTMCLQL
jgi:hypothetical protein